MSKKIVIILAISVVLTSCSKDQSPNKLNKSQIVLQKFSDIVSDPTLDESKLTELPRKIDLIKDMTTVKDQGSRGTCTIFATMGIVEGAIKKDLGVEVNLSEEYLNYSAQINSEYELNEGLTITDSLWAVYRGGLILESDWSYQPSWFKKGLPCGDLNIDDENLPSKCFTHNKPNSKAMNHRFEAKNIKYQILEKDTNAIIEFLATDKRPLLMTVVVNFNGWKDTGETNYNEELRQECIDSPSECGLHVIVITGYDMDKRVFMFKNSWGKKWGDNGYGTIAFDSVDNYVDANLYAAMIEGEVKIPKIAKSHLNVVNFDISTTTNIDKSISINLDGKIEDTSGKIISVSQYLVKKAKKDYYNITDDTNTEYILISDLEEIKIVQKNYVSIDNYYFIPGEENEINLETKNSSAFIIPSLFFTLPSVEVVMNSKDHDTFLKTSVYVHTDDNYVTLKTIYTPINL